METLLDLLRASRCTVVFSGAGVSTLSGLPDFRGEHGLNKRIDGNLVFDIAVFRREPAFFYTHGRDLVYGLVDHEPSLVHRECARLEQAGRVAAVVTQNIDMLHQRAGSRRVIELHGSPATHSCLDCGRSYPFAWARTQVQAGEVPTCVECGAVVKPDITFFGEPLPAGAFEEAWKLAAAADLMLVLGSTLLVQPAAQIPLVTHHHGGRLVIVNRGPTPLDSLAALRLDDLTEVFTGIAAAAL
ncbi:MAG: Sir2 family NAD-dependent protein deacetylase [Candidatus Krumholzibacteria bacterium]|jgi:NAD-dependent deacetylase|nr:Sir2 family NAD-dependent protein deacetylase [Candidatus Krumholzibacteria bacterium]